MKKSFKVISGIILITCLIEPMLSVFLNYGKVQAARTVKREIHGSSIQSLYDQIDEDIEYLEIDDEKSSCCYKVFFQGNVKSYHSNDFYNSKKQNFNIGCWTSVDCYFYDPNNLYNNYIETSSFASPVYTDYSYNALTNYYKSGYITAKITESNITRLNSENLYKFEYTLKATYETGRVSMNIEPNVPRALQVGDATIEHFEKNTKPALYEVGRMSYNPIYYANVYAKPGGYKQSNNRQQSYTGDSPILRKMIEEAENESYEDIEYGYEDVYYEETPKVIITDREDADIQLNNYNKRQYIIQLYEKVFGRTPGEGTINEYFDKTPQQIAISFMFDGESEKRNSTSGVSYADFVTYCYNWILGRDAGSSEIQSHVNTLEYYYALGGADSVIKRNLVRTFVESDEFMSKYGGSRKDKAINISTEAKMLYFKNMYYTVLGRLPAIETLNSWKNRTPQDMALGVLLSNGSEARNYILDVSYVDFVKFCYRAITGREPSSGTINYYANIIDTSSKQDIIKDIVESSTFLETRNKEIKTISFNDANLCLAIYRSLEGQGINVVRPTEKTLALYKNDIEKITKLDLAGKSISDVTGLSAFSNLTELNLKYNNLTKIDELSKLTKLKTLILSNNKIGNNIESICNLTSLEQLQAENCCLKDASINGKITKLTNLTKLFLSNNQLSNISSFTAFKKLKILRVDDNLLYDIGKVGNMNLEKFTMKRNKVTRTGTSIPLLSTLLYAQEKNYSMTFNNCKIENGKVIVLDIEKDASVTINKGNDLEDSKLSITNLVTKVEFNDPVLAERIQEKCPAIVDYKEENGKYIFHISTGALEHVISELDLTAIDDTKKITDISGLEAFTNLSKLILDNNNVQNLEKLSQMKGLRSLSLKSCGLTDLSALKTVTNLIQLDVSNNNISNIDAISSLTNLENLQLSNNKIGNNLQAIENLPKLKNLYISNNEISDLNSLKNAKMTNLFANYNSIDNFSVLNNANLKSVEGKNNEISIEADGRIADIPEIIKNEINKNGTSNLEFINCKIEDGKIVLDLGTFIGQIIIKEGEYSDTAVSIKNINYVTNPNIDVTYNLSSDRKQMTVTLKSDKDIRDVWSWEKISQREYRKTYDYNVHNQNLRIKDLYKNTVDVLINFDGVENENIPGLTISYSNTLPTNDDVIVTISSDVALWTDEKGGWVLSSDKKSMSKTMTENQKYGKVVILESDYDESIPYKDLTKYVVSLEVANIDKEAPQCTVEYSTDEKTKGQVKATIWAQDEIELVNSDDNKIVITGERKPYLATTLNGISICYKENTTETLEVKDLAGNISQVEIKVENVDSAVDGLNSKTDSTVVTNQNVILTVDANEQINVNNLENNQASIIKNAKTLYKEAKAKVTSDGMLYEVAGSLNVMPIMTGKVDSLGVEPFAYLSENENNNENGNELSYEITENGYGVINASDMVGNTDAVFYDINSIDKDSPIAGISSMVMNEDGSVTVEVLVNEGTQLTDDLNGWTLSDDMKTLTKTFTSVSNEMLRITDFAGNEIEIPIVVDDVNAVEYRVYYEYIEGTDKVLAIINADSELEEVFGWTMLEDKKSIAKVVRLGIEERVVIYDVDGKSSNVLVYVPNEDEESDELEPFYTNSEEEKTPTNDKTQSPNAFPQTGKYVIFTIILSIILTVLTGVTLNRYVKENAEDDNM